MKSKLTKISFIVLIFLIFMLSVQCLLFVKQQRKNEEHFVNNFCSYFLVFSDRFCTNVDTEYIFTAEGMKICLDEITRIDNYFATERPYTVNFLSSSTIFAPDFDALSLGELQRCISALTKRLNDGYNLETTDVEWIHLLYKELKLLRSTLYSENTLNSDFLKPDRFTNVFQEFFSNLVLDDRLQ
ncbi:MAG: hypothetical protein GXY01_08125 [Clostridiales bacterium]|nr:hypothetical protein [Clostridiales bacterium]